MWSLPWKPGIYDLKHIIVKLNFRPSLCCLTFIWYCSIIWGVNCVMYSCLFVRRLSDVVNTSGDIVVILCDHFYMLELYILKVLKLWCRVQYSYRIIQGTGFPLYLNRKRTCLNLSWHLRLISQSPILERISGGSRSNNDMFVGLSIFGGTFPGAHHVCHRPTCKDVTVTSSLFHRIVYSLLISLFW